MSTLPETSAMYVPEIRSVYVSLAGAFNVTDFTCGTTEKAISLDERAIESELSMNRAVYVPGNSGVLVCRAAVESKIVVQSLSVTALEPEAATQAGIGDGCGLSRSS